MNKHTDKCPLKFMTDDSGKPVVLAPTPNGQIAVIDQAGWDGLLECGLMPNWTFTGGSKGLRGQLRFTAGRAARRLTGAKQGQTIRYLNGDRTDLRSANLFVDASSTETGAESVGA